MAVTSSPGSNVTLLLTPPPTPHPTLHGGANITASTTPMSNETHQRYLRELALQEFYSTYDVWTGIRTALTLALFFVFTVTVILYKSKCKPRRKYELYPSLEDMQAGTLDYCGYWCSSPGSHDTGQKSSQVDSLGRCYNQGRGETGSAPLPTQRSVGSYSSLNNSFRVKSLPGSVMRINCSRNSSFEREDSQATAHSVRSEFLSVPGVRLQSTGSSSDGYSQGSSLHDLSGEMTPMALLGVPGLGPRGNKPLLQLGGMDWDSDHATAEWVQTIDINVIQPTPNISPCGSVRSVSDNSELARLPLPCRGRAASLLSLDSPDMDNRSIGSDSVFLEDSLGETFSSRSESVDSGTPSLLASPRPSLTPSPRGGRRKVQSFRLGINPSTSPFPPTSPLPVRALPPDASPRPRDQRSRQKLLQRQRVQEEPLGPSGGGVMPGPRRGGSPMTSLLVPTLGSHLRASCERLAAHTAMRGELEAGSSQSRSSSLLVPSASGSTEEEPMCAVFTVPSLRRCNSATSPAMAQEAEGWRRADSEQNPAMRRSDSASSRHRESSESSSGSDDASESVSFHLMVPALSLDQPSADTSRASSPALSTPSSPNCTPPPARRTPISQPQSPRTLSSPFSTSSTPSPTRGRIGRTSQPVGGGRGSNGLLAPGGLVNGRAGAGRGNGRRVLRRQYSQCVPPSPTLRDMPVPPPSLPTYMEEDDLEVEWCFPPAPPPSPFKAGQALYMRQDSCPPSPRLAARHLQHQDSTPTPTPTSPSLSPCGPGPLQHQDCAPLPSPRAVGYHLMHQDSTPSSTSPMPRQDSSPTPPHDRAPLNREGSSPTPPYGAKTSLTREDSSPPSSSFPSEMRDDSRHPSSSSTSSSSSSSSVMETPC
ncbi:serine/arginine repetitive matrix protein 1-like [Eriocheir sinensis]|uniref:serine/arginine repetitive matrix protein 1-like n=1 Tax=Eriocheir sinensis TaxID=95602 RepID=UPI0021C7ACBD|nr:serine/arginine repetitive matrix protein 1-like [Eriocheir sinensis]XP_050717829.1 serine/arginine repetitive matrix protein 1-like [Eriocheir sinensis]XP_050717830.1 serine/arginine repetitive matrix protein 1-like [Eriocheir sinensis]XP_050717831.1 serine/arginine repetitive matrix protein 1-like [Eriocheir sinensis]XP_050717832.1 serine/arginine repetitive matrix protein 1-like [Eriocheir sinensis]XP_050717833.1 serine/arginine repetitive matrix protein 1-like [Eriocheir sinensis]